MHFLDIQHWRDSAGLARHELARHHDQLRDVRGEVAAARRALAESHSLLADIACALAGFQIGRFADGPAAVPETAPERKRRCAVGAAPARRERPALAVPVGSQAEPPAACRDDTGPQVGQILSRCPV